MSKVILIRSYKKGDEMYIGDMVRNGVFSTMNNAFISNVFKEFTFQIMILGAAIMFIFFGMPLSVCLAVIPFVIAMNYLITYTIYTTKAMEIERDLLNISNIYMSNAFSHFWIAEVYDFPFGYQASIQFPVGDINSYIFVNSQEFDENFSQSVSIFSRKIVGTIGLSKSYTLDKGAWVKRLFVHSDYQRKGVASRLLKEAVDFAQCNRYSCVNIAGSEYSEAGRNMCLKNGFDLKQMYHKHIFGFIIKILMYEFTYSLKIGDDNYSSSSDSILDFKNK